MDALFKPISGGEVDGRHGWESQQAEVPHVPDQAAAWYTYPCRLLRDGQSTHSFLATSHTSCRQVRRLWVPHLSRLQQVGGRAAACVCQPADRARRRGTGRVSVLAGRPGVAAGSKRAHASRSTCASGVRFLAGGGVPTVSRRPSRQPTLSCAHACMQDGQTHGACIRGAWPPAERSGTCCACLGRAVRPVERVLPCCRWTAHKLANGLTAPNPNQPAASSPVTCPHIHTSTHDARITALADPAGRRRGSQRGRGAHEKVDQVCRQARRAAPSLPTLQPHTSAAGCF